MAWKAKPGVETDNVVYFAGKKPIYNLPAKKKGDMSFLKVPKLCGHNGEITYQVDGMEKRLPAPRIPCDRKRTLRAWVISDLHYIKGKKRMTRFLAHAVGRMMNRPFDVVFVTGDILDAENSEDAWPDFFEIFSPAIRSAVFVPVPGNHDYSEDNQPRWSDYLLYPITKSFYHLDLGPLRSYVLNSNAHADSDLEKDQISYLKEVDVKNRPPWSLAFLHHPPRQSARRVQEGSSDLKPKGRARVSVEEEILPELQNLQVDAVFAGDNHLYERIVDKDDRCTYVVSGPLGGNLRPRGMYMPHKYQQAIMAQATLSYLEISRSRMRTQVWDEMDNPVDNFELTH